MTRAHLVALATTLFAGCTCVTAGDDVLYTCGDGRTCREGYLCLVDNLCHPLAHDADAGFDAGREIDAGRDAGTDAGAFDAGVDAGTADAGRCLPIGGRCSSAGDCCQSLCLGRTCLPLTSACTKAVELQPGLVLGMTEGPSVSSGASCTAASGAEDVYVFATSAPSTPFFAKAQSTNGLQVPSLYLRDNCTPSMSVRDLVCASASGTGQAAVGLSLPPGTWFLFVDSPSPSGPDLDYSLTTSATTGDTCASPFTITLGSAPPLNSAILVSDTSNLTHDLAPSCTFGMPRDAVVAVSVPRPGMLTARLSADWDASLMLQRACGSGPELDCVDSRASTFELLTAFLTMPGTYFLWVSGHSTSDRGPFTLELDLQ